jgi:uncharacterized protein
MVAAASVPILRVWPWPWLAPLAAYAVLLAIVPGMRATFRGWRFGKISTPAVIATLVIGAGACVVLAAFDHFAKPDVRALGEFLPVSALGGLVVAGVIFSIGNALLEEVIFRGVLFEAVESQFGVWGAVIGTAALFGYGHMHGYPPGPMGAVLAGIFGLCLGWLRVFTGGLGLPVLAHIAADATIFTIVARAGIL